MVCCCGWPFYRYGRCFVLEHGGRLLAAAREYGIVPEDWLDLSTGVSPLSWPVPTLPSYLWSRLPEEDDELIDAACRYYGAASVLPVAGSQAAILALPRLRSPCCVGIPQLTYAEHAQAWAAAGHRVEAWTRQRGVEGIDVLVLVNPNNPTGERFTVDSLLEFHHSLAKKGGWLIVDEAFIDVTPEFSLAAYSHHPGLIVLRSVGKFFGLPGARIGFVLAELRILLALQEALGPWSLTGPSRWLAQQALADTAWQIRQRDDLLIAKKRLIAILQEYSLASAGGTALFQWVMTPKAGEIHHDLARQGILTRLFATPESLRFGLPATEADWQRLSEGLSRITV